MPEVIEESGVGQSFIENVVEEVHSADGQAIDIAIITAIVTAIGSIWQMCKSRNQDPVAGLRRRGPAARAAMWQAIDSEHDELTRREKRSLFRESMQKLRSMTDQELEQIADDLDEMVIRN